MLYEVVVKNKIGENIHRAEKKFKARGISKVVIDEAGFKEVRACSNLVIEKIFFVCPHCKKTFDKKKGFHTHINMAHPEFSYRYKEEW